jgi:BirA family transcriptional regulator, biotin operon repressor / biotin---[acetyl-CoA-carboxylase] ligase
MTPPAHAPLAIDDLRRARAAARFGGTVHYFETTDSTNTVAQQLARAGAAEGTVVIAETQTKGRGRLGRTWISPPFRNLYVSIVLRPPVAPSEAPRLGLVVGLATAETVAEWTSPAARPGAALKWPNDVLIDGRKVAGILMEMDAEDDRVRSVVAGIGVNLNMSPDDVPTDLRDKAISLSTAVGMPIDRVAFATRLLSRLEERYDQFVQHGFATLRPLWERLSCLQGRDVEIDDGGRRYRGRVCGIADDGALQLRDASGAEITVVAGEVTVVDGYEKSDQLSAVSNQPKNGGDHS